MVNSTAEIPTGEWLLYYRCKYFPFEQAMKTLGRVVPMTKDSGTTVTVRITAGCHPSHSRFRVASQRDITYRHMRRVTRIADSPVTVDENQAGAAAGQLC